MVQTEKKSLNPAQKRQQEQKHRVWLRAGVQLLFFLTMPKSLPKKTECSKGAENALKKVPENKTLQREPRSFSLERLLLL